jgi:hypothetical protein
MVVIAGHVAIAAIGDLAGHVRKTIPDRYARAVF